MFQQIIGKFWPHEPVLTSFIDSEYNDLPQKKHFMVENSSKVELSKNPMSTMEEFAKSKLASTDHQSGMYPNNAVSEV